MKLGKWFYKLVLKGFHFSLPFRFDKSKKKQFSFSIEFDESAIYDFNDYTEQHDWNKLIGFKKYFFSPRKNSFMVGWRCRDGNIELTYYYHGSCGKNYFNDNGVFKFDSNELLMDKKIIDIEFDLDKGVIKFIDNDKVNKISTVDMMILDTENKTNIHETMKSSKKLWFILHWFGGTNRARRNTKIGYKLNKN